MPAMGILPVLNSFSQDFFQKYADQSSRRSDSCYEHITAVVLETEVYLGDQIDITIDGQKWLLPLDVDAPNFRYFLSITPRKICDAKLPAGASLYLINSGNTPEISAENRKSAENCDFTPNPILQSEWRAGLPKPNYTRSFTSVEHVIVHHSAGSNSSTNYTQVVRDIYIYHTQSNGWSDIGYNYVVAQNGDLYAARDPGTGLQDNVLGAHFCGKNSTTMGICLLGNYEEANPPAALWQTLQNLVTYKIQKESLDPLTSSSHALGDIGHIAGHRDGCSTLCPGQSVYDRLASLRTSVANNLDACSANLDVEISALTLDAGDTILFKNLSHGYESYSWDFEGGTAVEFLENGDVKVVYYNPGIYGMTLTATVDNITESLSFDQVILVKGEPKIFPNPVTSNGELNIRTESDIENLRLYDLKGQSVPLIIIENGKYRLPEMKNGLYVLKFHTDQKSYTRKVLILN